MNRKERLDVAFIIGQFFYKDSHFFSKKQFVFNKK